MYGLGIVRGLGVTLKHLVESYVEDFRYLGKRYTVQNLPARQGVGERGIFTVQYPEEVLPSPEEFRFIPFLLYEDDTKEDRCTSCGICAKVCPPQCIWIVRSNDPKTGKPIPAPKEFYIDIDICMNCGFCAEFCPFDAIKMDHDFELATYDRTTNNIFDKDKLSKPVSYYASIRPTNYAREEALRAEKEKGSKRPPTSRPAAVAPVGSDPNAGKPILSVRGTAGTVVMPEEKRAAQAAEPKDESVAAANAPGLAQQAKAGLSAEDRERLKAAALARKAGGAAPAPAAKSAATESAPAKQGLSAEERERLKAAALARKSGGAAPAPAARPSAPEPVAPEEEVPPVPAASTAPAGGPKQGLSAEERERLKAAALARKAARNQDK